MYFTVITEAAVTLDEDNTWIDALMGIPLRIFLIALFSTILLVILRRLVNKLTERIATGENLNSKLGSAKLGTKKLGRAEVGQALGLGPVSPLATARKAQRARTIGSVLRSSVTLVIGLIATLMVLEQLGINTVPLLTSAGVAGVALGFGAQSLVKDFLSGTFMILEDQFGVGDQVIVGDVHGTVEAVALRITKVRDQDGTLWFLRNGEMLRVGNSTQGWAIASIDVSVPYDSDLAKVRASLQTAIDEVRNTPRYKTAILGQPKVSGIETMSATAISLRVTARTEPARQWDVARALREQIRTQFTQDGLTLAD